MITIILWIFRSLKCWYPKISPRSADEPAWSPRRFFAASDFQMLGNHGAHPKKNTPWKLGKWSKRSVKSFWDFMIRLCFFVCGGWYYTCLIATDEEKETSLLIVRMCRFPWIFRLGNVIMSMTQLRWRGSLPSADLISESGQVITPIIEDTNSCPTFWEKFGGPSFWEGYPTPVRHVREGVTILVGNCRPFTPT